MVNVLLNLSNEIADNIVDICQDITIKHPNTKIIISEVIQRGDDTELKPKIGQVNNLISKFCRQRSWGLIRHNNITTNHLNSYGLHVNKAGSSVFAKNVSGSDAPMVNTMNHAYVNQSIGYANDYSDTPGGSTHNNKHERGFKIVHLNIRSLIAHIEEFRIYIKTRNFDIISINETMLDYTISDHEISIPGVQLI